MSYFAILFAPLMVLLPAAGAVDPKADVGGGGVVPIEVDPSPAERYAPSQGPGSGESAFADGSLFQLVAERFRVEEANQVRIEQQMTIRISPQSQHVRRNMLMELPNREIGPRLVERKMGKCLKSSGIAGVQPDGGNRLLLFMRDRRIVSAELERTCRSRDFYSGFYLSRNTDGQLCVDRDMLLSRSGANCRLTRIRQLIESDD